MFNHRPHGQHRHYVIEELIVEALMSLLVGRVNEMLGEIPEQIILFEEGGTFPHSIRPEIDVASCERSEKERCLFIDAYAVKLSFDVPGKRSGHQCSVYAHAIDTALREDRTLGGIAEHTQIAKKAYETNGINFRVDFKLRITVEGLQ